MGRPELRLTKRFALFLAALSIAVPSAFAADTMYANDPQREIKEDIEDVFGLYILNPTRRHPKERVEISGDSAVLWLYHDPEKREFDKIKCEAIHSLLLGRFAKGGAQPFFAQFPKMNAVEVALFELKSTRSLVKEGTYAVSNAPSPILKVRVSRKKTANMNWEDVRAKLTLADDKKDKDKDKEKSKDKPPGVTPAQCVREGEKLVDSKWYNTRDYFP